VACRGRCAVLEALLCREAKQPFGEVGSSIPLVIIAGMDEEAKVVAERLRAAEPTGLIFGERDGVLGMILGGLKESHVLLQADESLREQVMVWRRNRKSSGAAYGHRGHGHDARAHLMAPDDGPRHLRAPPRSGLIWQNCRILDQLRPGNLDRVGDRGRPGTRVPARRSRHPPRHLLRADNFETYTNGRW
jgi:hypothetical protein